MNTYISTLFLFCHNEVPTLDAVILLTSWTMTREGGLGLCLGDGWPPRTEQGVWESGHGMECDCRVLLHGYVKRCEVHKINIDCTRYLKTVTSSSSQVAVILADAVILYTE